MNHFEHLRARIWWFSRIPCKPDRERSASWTSKWSPSSSPFTKDSRTWRHQLLNCSRWIRNCLNCRLNLSRWFLMSTPMVHRYCSYSNTKTQLRDYSVFLEILSNIDNFITIRRIMRKSSFYRLLPKNWEMEHSI